MVCEKWIMAKIAVYHSLLPSDHVTERDIKIMSHPNSNASFINIWDRLIWQRSPNLARSSKLVAASNCPVTDAICCWGILANTGSGDGLLPNDTKPLLNKSWLIISNVLWHSPKVDFRGNAQDVFTWYELEIYYSCTSQGEYELMWLWPEQASSYGSSGANVGGCTNTERTSKA